MMQGMAAHGSWLLQHVITTADTLYTRQISTAPSTFDRVTGIASGLLTLSILVFVIAAVPAAWNFRKSYNKINHLLERVYGDVNPIMRHASTVADNVDYITTAIRADVQQINATIAMANDRLQRAVETTEQRLNDFSALLAVIQEEAERTFVSTASTVRGVRRGADSFSRGEDGPKFAQATDEALADELDGLSDELLELDEEEEMIDGYDGRAAAPTHDVARPRVRSRLPRRGERPRSA